jgi:hypothetical protein
MVVSSTEPYHLYLSQEVKVKMFYFCNVDNDNKPWLLSQDNHIVEEIIIFFCCTNLCNSLCTCVSMV